MAELRYLVYLSLEEIDPKLNHSEASGDHFECATFASREEAEDFIHELLENHCACAAGEATLMAELTSPEFMTAGD